MSQRSCSPYSDRNVPSKKKKIVKARIDQPQRISENGQSKITNFFRNTQKKPMIEPKPVQKVLMKLQAHLESLKDQENKLLCEKEEIIQEQNQSKAQFEGWMKRSKELVQECVRDMSEYNRQLRAEIDPSIGFYSQNYTTFTMGIFGQQCQQKLQKLRILLKSSTSPQHRQIINQLISQHKDTLQHYKTQRFLYKQRLLLNKEQKNCRYSQKWPLLSNRYQIMELLGKGGFSQVYKAYDLDTNDYVAVKINILDGYKAQLKHYLVREFQNHCKLEHENIVKVQKVLEGSNCGGGVCIVLEFCDGPDLGTYIKNNQPIPQPKAKHIIKQVLLALSYLSSLSPKIIHYDLKPQNIMFSKGIIKILDFGLSKQIDNQHSKIALSNQGIGTYWYLPPQSFKQKNPQISQKVDIWSAGVILYQMLFGRKPFGHNRSQSSVYQEGIILEAYSVEFLDFVEVSEEAKSFIRHCLAYNQADRFTPAQALAHRFFL